MAKISVVINTLNEEKNLPLAIASVKAFADEVIVVDMYSSDKTAKIAADMGARVYEHKKTGYVEPARNFAIGKATGDWVLILDADEVIVPSLANKLKSIVKKQTADYYRIPRKNIIFYRWIKYSRWWPDYNIRFFKKGKVAWGELIHSVPVTTGKGEDLPSEEKYAIVHHNYATIEDYLTRMNTYSGIEADNLIAKGYKFIWKDLITKPLREFISRYLEGEGYKDGVHGLSLAFLQGFSEFLVYLKVWEKEKFLAQTISLSEASEELTKSKKELSWWIFESKIRTKKSLGAFILKLKRKIYQKYA